MFDTMRTAPNRQVELSPGPNPQIGTSDWRASVKFTELSPAYISTSLWPRFRAKYVLCESTGCWLWQAATDGEYGQIFVFDRVERAHRVSYQLHVGPIEEGLQVDHLCRNRRCVNPSHLEAVTQRENIIRGFGSGALNARKTHCPVGHELSGENLVINRRGWRRCRECARAREQARPYRKRSGRAQAIREARSER